jgi:hypothetical protein
MIYKFFLFFIILLLASCDYKPIYSKKNISNFEITEINLEGNKNIGRMIVPLLNLNQKKESDSKYTLQLVNNKTVKTVAKDRAGTATVYNTTITSILTMYEDGQVIKKKTFSENFTYNNVINKFDLSQYQRNIETNLIIKISNEILIFLNTI